MAAPLRDPVSPPPALREDEELRLLLQRMLVGARRMQQTPLAFEAGCASIVSAAWREVRGGPMPAFLRETLPWETLQGRLDRLVDQTLQDAPGRSDLLDGSSAERPCVLQPAGASRGGAYGAESSDQALEARLTDWLERACAIFRSVDSQALETLELRLEGADDREIAERLGLGLWLVNRIAADLRAAWKEE